MTHPWPRIRRAGAALLLVLTACRTITVDPPGNVLPALPEAKRPALDFALHVTEDPQLWDPGLTHLRAEVVDGEDLADLVPTLRDALEATNAFSTIRRAPTGQRLHCDLSVRMYHMTPEGLGLVITAGLWPHVEHEYYEVIAIMSAPGRAPQTYTVRGHAETLLWSPLIPIGLVQWVVQSGTLQQTIDALVARAAADGWLRG